MNYRKIVVALCANLAVMGAAHAQAAFGTGFYAGAGVGNAHSNVHTNATANRGASSYYTFTDFAQISNAGEGAISRDKFSGSLFAGYDRRYGDLLAGVEASVHSLSLNDGRSTTAVWLTSPASTFTLRQSFKADWQATVRARFGVVRNQWLAYVTAGAAFTRATYTVENTDTLSLGLRGSNSIGKSLTGWTVGVGGEYALSRNLSLRGEYLYTDFGSVNNNVRVTNPSFPALSNTLDSSATLKTQLVTVGLAYRF